MKNFLAAIVVLLSLTAVAHAEVQSYTGTGEYYMSDFETPNVAQQRAKQRAEQNACEQAGVFVKSFSRSVNAKLIEDEIIAMTSGILKIVDVQFHRENFDNNTTLIRATITAQIDSDDVLKWLNKDSQERATLVTQNETLRKANADQEYQISELKRQLAAVKTPRDEERISREFADADKIFLSNQKVDEAWKLHGHGDYLNAIKLHDEAIKLNPNNAQAWYGRGTAHDELGQYHRAIQDFDTAVELNPNFSNAYNNRGNSYAKLGQLERALKNYNQALALNPNSFDAYNGRGNIYFVLRQYEWAINDYDRALQLNPNFAIAYYNRGNAYVNLNRHERAVQDYDKAIELKPRYTETYNNRGWTYYNLKQYERAIADFNKAVEFNPNFALAYQNRGLAYQALGDEAKAQADFTRAKQLGYGS